MNKYQEALDNVKIAPSFMGGNDEYRRHLDSAAPFLKDIATLQELVDKETPKKPKTISNKNRRGSEWVCPKCKTHIAYFDELGIGTVRDLKYCSECGQRLDLGEVDYD